jgi:RNA polymerase sigma-70 factor (ECF subfamily)
VTDDTDAGLLARLQGDPAALEMFYRRHRDRVVAYAVRRCRQPADVTDLVAATFLAVLEKPGSFDPRRGDAGAWLTGIAARQWLLLCRAERKQQDLRERVPARELSSDDIARLEDQIDAARASEPAWAALDQVDPCHSEVLRLVGPDGLTSREAAAALGISAGAFRVRLMRARRAVKRVLSDSARAVRAEYPLPSPSIQQSRRPDRARH